ncbi:hypothetical protein [Stappia albiluteola]|uniref:hypothetical protein n=1 Tax=Stappia albiluteola TaxID=2758565 RepID=UPI0015F49E3E|nr:hypothetical protein [Stappia albiluteola]
MKRPLLSTMRSVLDRPLVQDIAAFVALSLGVAAILAWAWIATLMAVAWRLA